MTVPGRGDASASGPAFRGAVLIAVAVVVGAVLLGSAFDRGGSTSDGGGGQGPGEETTTTGADGTTTTATPVTHPVNQVLVLVLNGAETAGIAASATNTLNALGYVTIEPGNLNPNVPASVVYFAPGYDGDAPLVATALGLTAAQVLPLPVPPAFDPRGANVVVVLGPEVQPG